MAKHIARRDFKGLSKDMVSIHSNEIINQVAKKIQAEFNYICSDTHNSLLRGYGLCVRDFCWDSIWNELQQHTPSLLMLLSNIIPGSSKILHCTIICMILKHRHPKMALLQRVISVVLYGNAVHKQVCCINA